MKKIAFFGVNVIYQGKAAKQNGYGRKIVYCWCPNRVPHLPAKYYKCSFKFVKIIVKNPMASFLWTQSKIKFTVMANYQKY